MKKKVLDNLYPLKENLYKLANYRNTESYQLPENDVSGRNLKCGESIAYSDSAKQVDQVIARIIEMTEE